MGSYLTHIPLILALHLLHHLEAHLPIDLHIGHALRALEVAFHPLLVRPIGHNLEQLPAHAFPLRLGTHGHDVAEIVAPGVRPDFFLGFRLTGFPDPVPLRVEAAATQVSNVVEQLAERENPRLKPGVPTLRFRRRMRREPAGHSYDLGRCVRRRAVGLLRDKEEGIVDPPQATGCERADVSLFIEL